VTVDLKNAFDAKLASWRDPFHGQKLHKSLEFPTLGSSSSKRVDPFAGAHSMKR
jgi:hypothetical protein